MKKNYSSLEQIIRKVVREGATTEAPKTLAHAIRDVHEGKKKLEKEDAADVADTAAEYLVPYYSAVKKVKSGDYTGAAVDAAIDTGALALTPFTGGGSLIARTAGKAAVKGAETAVVKAGEKAAVKGAETAAVKSGERNLAQKTLDAAGAAATSGGSSEKEPEITPPTQKTLATPTVTTSTGSIKAKKVMKEESEWDKLTSSQKMAKHMAHGFASAGHKAEMHDDGSATVHTKDGTKNEYTGKPSYTSANVVDSHLKHHGFEFNHPAKEYDNHTQSMNGHTIHVTKTKTGHAIHIKSNDVKESVELDEMGVDTDKFQGRAGAFFKTARITPGNVGSSIKVSGQRKAAKQIVSQTMTNKIKEDSTVPNEGNVQSVASLSASGAPQEEDGGKKKKKLKEESGTAYRRSIENVARPDSAKSPFDRKSKLAKQGEIKTKIIEANAERIATIKGVLGAKKAAAKAEPTTVEFGPELKKPDINTTVN